ncbi:23K endoprotease [Possum adenovirus 1]|uniref:Protease n=1 Tax=Possum adenovirus 1 TaxID=150098 RepID=Q8V5K7_9ADEN|nr:23K endoprotease [Possum adenovirus 1]AAL73248.1 23K endoprotease [Possum adenovirus 1]
MSGTSEHELKSLIASLGVSSGFLGTFDCRFPGFIQKEKFQTAIVNTGPREKGGIHWIALAWNPLNFKMYLFDPLGWKEKQLAKYYGFSYRNMIARSALNTPDRCVTLVRNEEAVQCTCSGACGLFCVFFIYCFNKYKCDPFNNPLFQRFQGSYPCIKPASPALLHENQNILYNFLNSKSDYFNKNQHQFVTETKIGLIKTHN